MGHDWQPASPALHSARACSATLNRSAARIGGRICGRELPPLSSPMASGRHISGKTLMRSFVVGLLLIGCGLVAGFPAFAQLPGTPLPGTRQPSAQQPGARQPGTRQPGTRQPGASQLRASQPNDQQQGVQQPGAGISAERSDIGRVETGIQRYDQALGVVSRLTRAPGAETECNGVCYFPSSSRAVSWRCAPAAKCDLRCGVNPPIGGCN